MYNKKIQKEEHVSGNHQNINKACSRYINNHQPIYITTADALVIDKNNQGI
jgi:hypothetical protein